MTTPAKRPLEDQNYDLVRPSKIIKTENDENENDDENENVSLPAEGFDVEVVLYSQFKAQRFDPRSTEASPLTEPGPRVGNEGSVEAARAPGWRSRVDAWQQMLSPVPEGLDILTFNEENWHQSCYDYEHVAQDWLDLMDDEVDSLDEFDEDLEASEDRRDESPSAVWLEAMDAFAYGSQPGGSRHRIGLCKTNLIRRSEMSRRFHSKIALCGPNSVARMGDELFDRYGRLRSEFKYHPIRKGSGIWGDELNRNDILVIEHIEVVESSRRRGLGRAMVAALLDKTRSKTSTPFFVIVSPDTSEYISADKIPPEKVEAYDVAVQFWRSMGFRRVGNTHFFAWASDLTHSCHALPALKDFEPVYEEALAILPIAAPLGDVSCSDLRCLEQLKNSFRGIPRTDPRWAARDEHGNTLLHIAGCATKSRCVGWLLKANPSLAEVRNYLGHTALESTMRHLNSEYRENESIFEGYGGAAITTMYLLEHKGRGANPITSAEQLRLKFCCTCGACINGFLSPRMRQTLLSHATLLYTKLSEYVELPRRDEEARAGEMHGLSMRIRTHFHPERAMLNGFIGILGILIRCLRDRQVPTYSKVKELMGGSGQLESAAQLFVQAHGSINAVFTKVLEQAMCVDEWRGYPPFDGPGERLKVRLQTLPACRNDHEYELVAHKSGNRSHLKPSMAFLRREAMLNYMME